MREAGYWGRLLSIERNQVREPDLTGLGDLPRGEAMRVAMIKYGWDAKTAGRKVDAEQGSRAQEGSGHKMPQSA